MKKDSLGFSVTELIVVVGLSAIVLLGSLNVMTFLKVSSNKAQLLSELSISRSIGNRFLWIHFKNSAPSFNFLRGSSFADDNGRQFYDYIPDYPSSAFSPPNNKRVLTLSPQGRNSFVVMIVNNIVRDPGKGYSNTLYADPASFFDISGSTGALSYTKLMNYFTLQNPKFLASGGVSSLINFFSPIVIRNSAHQNDFPPAVPNSVSMVVRYEGNAFVKDDFGGVVNYENALTGTNQANLEQFIRELPPSGGGIPPFMIRSVRLLKYEIVSHDTNLEVPSYDLRYSEWSGSDWVRPVVVASKVTKLILTRPDITNVLITAKLEINGK